MCVFKTGLPIWTPLSWSYFLHRLPKSCYQGKSPISTGWINESNNLHLLFLIDICKFKKRQTTGRSILKNGHCFCAARKTVSPLENRRLPLCSTLFLKTRVHLITTMCTQNKYTHLFSEFELPEKLKRMDFRNTAIKEYLIIHWDFYQTQAELSTPVYQKAKGRWACLLPHWSSIREMEEDSPQLRIYNWIHFKSDWLWVTGLWMILLSLASFMFLKFPNFLQYYFYSRKFKKLLKIMVKFWLVYVVKWLPQSVKWTSIISYR